MTRIGLFGGTFDPVHDGHLRMAARAGEEFGLQQVQFIPSLIPPHKSPMKVADPFHRYAMVALATVGRAEFIPSPAEILGRGPSYTIDTVREFRRAAGREAEVFFLIGSDCLREIETWKDHLALLESCHFIVLPRGGEGMAGLPGEVRRRLREVGEGEGRQAAAGAREPTVFLWRSRGIPLSSTEVRRRIGRGEPVTGMIHPGVEEYIRKTGLYAEETAAV